MIKVKVTEKGISILGHANYDDYGKDIVCAAVSGIVMTSVEGIAKINSSLIDINKSNGRLDIIINKHDDIGDKLIDNMLMLLNELSKKYPKNIKVINKEE